MQPIPGRKIWLSPAPSEGLEVAVRPVYSAAMHHAGIPLVADLRRTTNDSAPLHARIEVESLQAGASIEVTGSGHRITVDTALRPGLDAVVGVRRSRVRLMVGRSEAEAEISLHEAWHWPLLPEAWPMIASYVLPHDGIILRLLADARSRGGGSVVKNIFDVLRERYEIGWIPPRVVRTAEGISLQVLLAPWHVLSDQRLSRGAGSCLDLSLQFAGVLEAAGEAPLVLFLLDPAGTPEHAMPGTWSDGGHRYRPILRGEEVRGLLELDRITPVDATRVCPDRGSEFCDAQTEARRLVANAVDIVAVDIAALRPPHGPIHPLESSFDPVVLAAVAEAEAMANEMAAQLVETLHLFHGLWAAGGPVSGELLERTRLDRDEVLLWIRSGLTRRSHIGHRHRTRGFSRCLVDARENARTQGSAVTREADLWWAVFASGSASLSRVFHDRPAAWSSLIDALAEISPPSRPESTR